MLRLRQQERVLTAVCLRLLRKRVRTWQSFLQLKIKNAKETAELIQHAIDMVENGTTQVSEMTQAIDKISGAVESIAGTVSEVASSSDEQATAIAQVKQAIGQISQVVQTDSATSEECAAAAETLSNHAQGMRDVVSGFKLKGAVGFGGQMGGGFAAPSMDSGFSSQSSMSEPYNDMDNESIISLEGNLGKF